MFVQQRSQGNASDLSVNFDWIITIGNYDRQPPYGLSAAKERICGDINSNSLAGTSKTGF